MSIATMHLIIPNPAWKNIVAMAYARKLRMEKAIA